MYEQLPIEKVEPNSWNPNKMQPEQLVKLEEGMRRVYKETGKLPPITVRTNKKKKGYYEIIDGQNRWSVLKKWKHATIDAFILDVPDDMARVLTATLNWLHGEADPNKYPVMVVEALKANPEMDVSELAKLLPETEDMLNEMIVSSQEAVDILDEIIKTRGDKADGPDGSELPERWVNMNFSVPLEVASIVDAELDRIAERLSGKNRRVRALEYMAVNSALTPLDEVDKKIEEKEPHRENFTEKGQERMVKAGALSDTEREMIEEELAAVAQVEKKPKTAPKKKKGHK